MNRSRNLGTDALRKCALVRAGNATVFNTRRFTYTTDYLSRIFKTASSKHKCLFKAIYFYQLKYKQPRRQDKQTILYTLNILPSQNAAVLLKKGRAAPKRI